MTPLVVFGDATSAPISVQAADVSVQGFPQIGRALVHLTLTLCNASRMRGGRCITGKLKIELPESASVSGFEFVRGGGTDTTSEEEEAKDDPMWFPACPLPRKKAQEVVHREIEKGRQVAVLSQTDSGNRFEIELFPFPHGQVSRFRVCWVQPVDDHDHLGAVDTERWRELFDFGEGVPLGLTVDMGFLGEDVEFPHGRVLAGEVNGETHFACLVQLPPQESLPVNGDITGALAVTATGTTNTGENLPRLAEPETQHISVRPEPVSNLVILWDSSFSQRGCNAEKRLNYVKSVFEALQADSGSSVSDSSGLTRGGGPALDLWTFDVSARCRVRKATSLAELNIVLDDMIYDGATDLQAVVNDVLPQYVEKGEKIAKRTLCLLFSDGQDSMLSVEKKDHLRRTVIVPTAFANAGLHCRLFCVAGAGDGTGNGAGLDLPLLRNLALSGNGRCVAESELVRNPNLLVDAVLDRSNLLLKIETDQDEEEFCAPGEDEEWKLQAGVARNTVS